MDAVTARHWVLWGLMLRDRLVIVPKGQRAIDFRNPSRRAMRWSSLAGSLPAAVQSCRLCDRVEPIDRIHCTECDALLPSRTPTGGRIDLWSFGASYNEFDPAASCSRCNDRAVAPDPLAWSGPVLSHEASARKLLDADRQANHPTLSGAEYARTFGMLEERPGDDGDPRGRKQAVPLSSFGDDDADEDGMNKMDAIAGAFLAENEPDGFGIQHMRRGGPWRPGRYLVDVGWRARGISSGEPERFFKNAVPVGGDCLLWIDDRKDGYGRFRRDDGTRTQAHHYAFAHYTDRSLPLPRRLTVVQTCGNRGCVLEEHLDEGRKRDNTLGRTQGSRRWSRGEYFRPSQEVLRSAAPRSSVSLGLPETWITVTTERAFARDSPIPLQEGEGHAPSTPLAVVAGSGG